MRQEQGSDARLCTPEELARLSKQITRAHSPLVFRLGQLLFSPGALPAFCLAYAYFRWLDDSIDAPDAAPQECQALAHRQRHLLDALYAGVRPVLAAPAVPEQMLELLVERDRTQGCVLQEYLSSMLAALEFDAGRRHRLASQAALERYSWLLGKAYTCSLQVFTGVRDRAVLDDSRLCRAGYAAHQVHILRDFGTDLMLGYCNISRERLAELGWSVDKLGTVDVSPWTVEVAERATQAFREGLGALRGVKNVRCRLLGYATSAQYLHVLKTLRHRGHRLGGEYHPSALDKVGMLVWAVRQTWAPGSGPGRVRLAEGRP